MKKGQREPSGQNHEENLGCNVIMRKTFERESWILILASQTKYGETIMSEWVYQLDNEQEQKIRVKNVDFSRGKPKKWKIEAMKPLYLVRYE